MNIQEANFICSSYKSGGLYLRGLTIAKDLVLPKTVSGGLDLRGLTIAKDLVLPKTVSGWIDLRGLTSAEKKEIRDKGYSVLG